LSAAPLRVTINGVGVSCSGASVAGSGSLSCGLPALPPGSYSVQVTTVGGSSNSQSFTVTSQ